MLFDSDMLMNLTDLNMMDSKQNTLTDDKVGLQRGNMFNDEYKPYKNYNPKEIIAKTEKDALMLKLYELNFAIIDLNLLLDLHPEDNKMYEIYKKYVNSFDKAKKMYEENYGPLEITCVDNESYDWIKNPWPWDKDGGTKYV